MMQASPTAQLSPPGESAVTAYDEVVYAGYPFAQTHPDRLATQARFFGMSPAAVTGCRVLELGCGDGGNLIPMAYGLPGARFVGVDLAAQPVARGQSMIAEMGLSNIELQVADIAEIGERYGQFDYIIAHGVYSWVPAPVRERMLALCRSLLMPQGVAYISYNTYPGYKMREITRDMMRFHVRGIHDPAGRVAEGVELVKLLLQNYDEPQAETRDLYGAALAAQLEMLESHRHAEQIYHDDLSEVNQPFYFHEFAAAAAAHGLQYLAEADLGEMQDYLYPAPIREFLSRFSDEELVEKEQYLDYLKGRAFRQTLLCHREVELRRQPEPDALTTFYLASSARPTSTPPELSAARVEEFHGQRNAKLQTDHPPAKAALLALGAAWPRALSWTELLPLAGDLLRRAGLPALITVDDEAVLTQILLAAVQSGMVQLHLHRPEFLSTISERPEADRLARQQAGHSRVVTNRLHKIVEMDDELSLRLLQLLDGTRNHAALCDALCAFIAERGSFTRADGSPLADEHELRRLVAVAINRNLEKLAGLALLTA